MDQIQKFQFFLDSTLLPSIHAKRLARDELQADHQDLITTRHQLKVLNAAVEASPDKPIKTMMNLGNDFYMSAKIQDLNGLIIHVGRGIYPQMTQSEAIAFLNKKECISAR